MLTLSSKATGECISCLCHLPYGRTSQDEEDCEEANLHGSDLASIHATVERDLGALNVRATDPF